MPITRLSPIVLGLHVKTDFASFGSDVLADLPPFESREASDFEHDRSGPAFPYVAAERAIHTGYRRDLDDPRVSLAVFGHAVSALAAFEVAKFINEDERPDSLPAPPEGIDALLELLASHLVLQTKYLMALDVLHLSDGTGKRCVQRLFGHLGIQTFLMAPLEADRWADAEILPLVAALPYARTADGVLVPALQKSYSRATATRSCG